MTQDEPRADDVAGGGWAGLEALDGRLRSAPSPVDDERRRMGELMLRVFGSPEGREVMGFMLDQTVRVASVPNIGAEAMLMRPDMLATYVLWNEAQKAFVLRLRMMMEAALRPPEKQET